MHYSEKEQDFPDLSIRDLLNTDPDITSEKCMNPEPPPNSNTGSESTTGSTRFQENNADDELITRFNWREHVIGPISDVSSDVTNNSDLCGRSKKREDRTKPWTDPNTEIHRGSAPTAETHYQGCLPHDQWLQYSPRKYVHNVRYGDAYRVPRKTFTRGRRDRPVLPERRDWLIENDFRIWLYEKSDDHPGQSGTNNGRSDHRYEPSFGGKGKHRTDGREHSESAWRNSNRGSHGSGSSGRGSHVPDGYHVTGGNTYENADYGDNQYNTKYNKTTKWTAGDPDYDTSTRHNYNSRFDTGNGSVDQTYNGSENPNYNKNKGRVKRGSDHGSGPTAHARAGKHRGADKGFEPGSGQTDTPRDDWFPGSCASSSDSGLGSYRSRTHQARRTGGGFPGVPGYEDDTHTQVYKQYHAEDIRKVHRDQAATKIQKIVRGFLVRNRIHGLRSKAVLEHGRAWPTFARDYKALVTRIQKRHEVKVVQTPFDLRQVADYQRRKERYEAVFADLAVGGALPRDRVLSFFHQCGLSPTEREVNSVYNSIFKGCGSKAELVFVVDFADDHPEVQRKLSRDLVVELMAAVHLGQDNVRAAYVTYGTNCMLGFGLDAHGTLGEIRAAIESLNPEAGDTTLEGALSRADTLLMTCRDDVPKTVFVISDGRKQTSAAAENQVEALITNGASVIAIGVGSRVDLVQLDAITGNPDHVFHLPAHHALWRTRHDIMKSVSLANCEYCQLSSSVLLGVEPSPGTRSGGPRGVSGSQAKTKASRGGGGVSRAGTRGGGRGGVSGSRGGAGGGVSRAELMEVLWTLAPPAAAGLPAARRSTWMRPVVDGEETCQLIDEDTADAQFETCLRFVMEARLQRESVISLPKGAHDVAEVRDVNTAVKLAGEYFKQNKGLLWK